MRISIALILSSSSFCSFITVSSSAAICFCSSSCFSISAFAIWLLITSQPTTARRRNKTESDISNRRVPGLPTLRSTASTVPPCRSVTEFNRFILIMILLYSPRCESDGNCHLRHYLVQITPVELPIVDFDVAKRIQNIDRKLQAGG